MDPSRAVPRGRFSSLTFQLELVKSETLQLRDRNCGSQDSELTSACGLRNDCVRRVTKEVVPGLFKRKMLARDNVLRATVQSHYRFCEHERFHSERV